MFILSCICVSQFKNKHTCFVDFLQVKLILIKKNTQFQPNFNTIPFWFLQANMLATKEDDYSTINKDASGNQNTPQSRVFQCACSNTYYENWNLFLHMREVHKKHICLICLGLFASAARLAQHLVNRHKLDSKLEINSKRDLMENGSCYLMCETCEHVFHETDDNFLDDEGTSYQMLRNHLCESFMETCSICGMPPTNHKLHCRGAAKKSKISGSRKSSVVKTTTDEVKKSMSDNLNYNVSTTSTNELKLSFKLSRNGVNLSKPDSPKSPQLNGNQGISPHKLASCLNLDQPKLVPKLKVKIPKFLPPPEESEDEDWGDEEEESEEEWTTAKNEIDSNVKRSEKIETEIGSCAEKGETDQIDVKKDIDQINVDNESVHFETIDEHKRTPPHKVESVENDSVSVNTIIDEYEHLEIANEDCQLFELVLDEPLDKISIKDLLRICLRSTITFCLYCYHARRIVVNGKQLAIHMITNHRFSATVNSITAEELLPETIVARFKTGLDSVVNLYLNLETYDSDGTIISEGNEKIFECFQCRFMTTLHKELYLHNRKLHLKTVLLCLMCKSTFFNYSELLCHICPGQACRVLHNDLKFRCSLCSLDDLPSAFRLMVHLRKHHATCEVCLEECFDQFRLSNHAWKHKLQHFCYRCGIAYRNKPDITKHLFWKHGTESVACKRCLQKKWPHIYHFCTPPSSFNCEQCSLTFSRAVCLKVHKRLHSDELPHLCPEEGCDERFISKKLMLKHSRVHTDVAEVENFYPYLLKSENEEIIETEPEDRHQVAQIEQHVTDPPNSAVDSSNHGTGLVDIMDLPAPNLSESDSSDEDTDCINTTVLVPGSETTKIETSHSSRMEPVDDIVRPAEIDEVTNTQAIINIWENFKSYQATQTQNQSSEGYEEENEDLIAPLPPPILHVLQSDHDYSSMYKVVSDCKKDGNDEEDIREIKDINVMRMMAEKRNRSTMSSSSSESDSDSSCTCGSDCSCSSSNSSDGSSSSNKNSSDEQRRVTRKQKRSARKMKEKHNTSDHVDVVDTDNKTISKAFQMMRESDLETDETDTDEEFYDKHPHKMLIEKRKQLTDQLGDKVACNSRSSTPSLPPSEENHLKVKKPKLKKRKKIKKSKHEKHLVPPLKINIPSSIPKLRISEAVKCNFESGQLNTSSHGGSDSTLVAFPEESQHQNDTFRKFALNSDMDSSLKRSKRRRIPNRFYGYSSDDESSLVLTPAAGFFKPTPPPNLTWRKEDLPSPSSSSSKSIALTNSCNSNIYNFHSSPKNYSQILENNSSWNPQQQPDPAQEEAYSSQLRHSSELASSIQPAVHAVQQQPLVPSIKIRANTVEGKSQMQLFQASSLADGTSDNFSPVSSPNDSFKIETMDDVDQENRLYCYCKRAYDPGSEMIACDGENCAIEWFHFECVGILMAPIGKWYCPQCSNR